MTFKPLLIANPIENPTKSTRVSDELCHLHNDWYEAIVKPQQFEYSTVSINPLPLPKPYTCNNDFNLTEDDKTKYNGKLENTTILQFLNRSLIEKSLDSLGIDLQPISDFVPTPQTPISFFSIPKPLRSITDIYIKVTIDHMAFSMCPSKVIEYLHGMLFLYDPNSKLVISDTVYFGYKPDKPIFLQTNLEEAYFQIQKPYSKSIQLICILLHEKAYSLEAFINSYLTNSDLETPPMTSPIPFAFSHLNIFEGDIVKKFAEPWSKFNSSDILKNLGTLPEEQDAVGIDGAVSVELLEFDKMPKVCLNTDNTRALPMLALTTEQEITDPIASIVISGVQILFNNAPKGDFVFFRLYVCKEQTDPFKPDGLKCIASRSVELLRDFYSSIPVLSGKKVHFPDVVRLLLDKPLPPTTHLIFHILSLTNSSETLNKVAIYPLFQQSDGTMVQFRNIWIPVSPMKYIKAEDYLTKQRTSSKTNVILDFHHPIYFYPPKHLIQFAEAVLPEQIEWQVIMNQCTQETLLSLAIPIVSKLLRMISPSTAKYIIEYLYKFKDNASVSVIKSWIYTHFDPATIKHYFLSSYTNSIDQMIQMDILGEESNAELIPRLCYSYQLLSDIFLISFPRRTEEWVPKSIFSMFRRISQLVALLLTNRDKEQSQKLNKEFAETLFKFRTLSDDPGTLKSLSAHIRILITLNTEESFICVYDCLKVFASTNQFAIFVATQLPVRPLSSIMFSPFHPVVSSICLAVHKTFTLNNETTLMHCIQFLNQLFLPLELIEPVLSFRIGYAFFAILDIISSFYASDLVKKYHFDFVPVILFLLAYSPSQLLRNFFTSISANFQTLFIDFLSSATESIIDQLTPEVTIKNGLFDQMTQRCLQFLFINLNSFRDCLPSVIRLVSLFFSPYQRARNFPKIFDIVSRLIKIYPCQRLLVQNLLEVLTRKQHIARCFATSSILLFFKADFDERRTVTVSTVEVIDALTTMLLHSPSEQLSVYKLMLNQIKALSPFFQNEALTEKLNDRMDAAFKIAEVIEKLRLASHPPDERCIYVMQIANQHRTFPSMRMKWLKEIVRINLNAGNNVSAFIAQLHICALISTVFMHEDTLSSSDNILPKTNSNPKLHKSHSGDQKKKDPLFNFNLIVTQPIRNARTKGGKGKYMLNEKDFAFNPSVLVETQINFDSISSDFKFISSDFTIDLLKQSIKDAISYGEQSQLYYDVRCLYSLLMRIYATERNYEGLAEVSKGLSKNFHDLTATETQTHDTFLSFFVSTNRVYCLESRKEKELIAKLPNHDNLIRVVKYDPAPTEMEHLHCWKRFRGIVKREVLDKVSNADAKEIQLVQYTTKEELPRFTMYSEIADIETVVISLSDHVVLETEKLRLMMQQTTVEFEKCFPTRQLKPIEGDHKQNIEKDMDRIFALFDMTLKGDDSVFGLLKLLKSKDDKGKSQDLAVKLRASIEVLLKVYHRAIEYLQSPEHFLKFKEIRELTLAFTTEFKLPEANSKSFEGKRDPLTEHIEYEVS